MSNTDSFIDEVTEEVQRDKLFKVLKRWGWVGAVAVILLVGGAAWNEWRKASERNAAQSFGDALISAIEADDGGDSLASVEAATPEQAAIASQLAAADALTSGDSEKAVAELEKAATLTGAPPIYKELAAFKAALALPPETPPQERLAAFEELSAPGAPLAVLAREQQALVMIEMGNTDEALTLLNSLLEQSNATPGLQRRVSELIVALGGTLGDASEEN